MRTLSTGIVAGIFIMLNGSSAISDDKYVIMTKDPIATTNKAEGATPLPSEIKCQPTVNNSKALSCEQAPNSLKGLHWGLGILHDASRGGVGEVAIVPGAGGVNTVRIVRQNKNAARAAFELHYFLGKGDNPLWAWGPFISLNSAPAGSITKDSAFSSFGAGLMIGAKVDTAGQHSVNFGVGWLVDTDVKQLAPGVYDGATTTLTKTDDLLRTRTSQGFMSILSYNFTF